MRMVVVNEAAAGGSTKAGNVTGGLLRGQTRRRGRKARRAPGTPSVVSGGGSPQAVRYSSAMKKKTVRNAFYAQSGGVSAVINASACGVIESALRARQIGKVYAGRNGILGALTEDLIDVGRESPATIRGLRYTRFTAVPSPSAQLIAEAGSAARSNNDATVLAMGAKPGWTVTSMTGCPSTYTSRSSLIAARGRPRGRCPAMGHAEPACAVSRPGSAPYRRFRAVNPG